MVGRDTGLASASVRGTSRPYGERRSTRPPVEEVPIDVIREIDEDCWFGGRPATVRDVVSHARRIVDTDLSPPVILASDGQVLDGMHRIAKAVLCGQVSVTAKRLATDPDPDWLSSGEQAQ